jgi:hypothetical protein
MKKKYNPKKKKKHKTKHTINKKHKPQILKIENEVRKKGM